MDAILVYYIKNGIQFQFFQGLHSKQIICAIPLPWNPANSKILELSNLPKDQMVIVGQIGVSRNLTLNQTRNNSKIVIFQLNRILILS